MSRERDEIAALIDHTLLRPEATEADILKFCGEARNMALPVCASIRIG